MVGHISVISHLPFWSKQLN